MNIGNITSDNFNLDGNGKDIQIEVYEQLIEQLQQENKILKENNMSMQEEMARTWEKADLYKEVIDEVRKYAENDMYYTLSDGNTSDYTIEEAEKELLQILDKAKD